MKKDDNFNLVAKTVGIIITAWILFLVVIELINALNTDISSFFYSDVIFSSSVPYIDPNALILVYLFGYAMVWWKKLWGSALILLVSTFGILFSQAGDIRFHFILTLIVGLLYFVNWCIDRKKAMVS